ncbi:hypothetical protein HHK36_001390 [Tetracentron sinense]|uniref:Uncharacterized protein n=1 Tax=Tetracentron sinense TaxID=13715 RepID=A0A834ZY22_TETSI|nr:hypothetical protein HHK36_001390 [Tetracentron sinense]
MASTCQRQCICATLFILGFWVSQAMSRSLHEASMPEQHELWMGRFGRVYKDSEEKEMRFKIFKANVELINSFNGVGSRSYKLSVNEFADQTNEEFVASRNGYKRSSPRKSSATSPFKYQNVTKVPSSMDWRKKGAVTPVKDQGQCAAKINGFEDVPSNSEKALLKAVANQPVSVAIDASGSDFQFYSSGVFTGECGTSLDHGVTAVGYGTSADGTKYWLVKNSWGTEWGVDGYIMMQRDVDASEGVCGIAMEASYPTA